MLPETSNARFYSASQAEAPLNPTTWRLTQRHLYNDMRECRLHTFNRTVSYLKDSIEYRQLIIFCNRDLYLAILPSIVQGENSFSRCQQRA